MTHGLAGLPTVVLAVPVMITFAAASVIWPLATRLMLGVPVMVMPSGVMLMMLVPAITWMPAGVIRIDCVPEAVLMVMVGGASVMMIWLPSGVRIMRICGSGDGSGGGAIALHRQPMM